MTGDKIVKDTARDPERESLGRLRGGLRAAAKKAVRKVAKKSGQRRATKKTTAAAAKTTARSARVAKGGDKPAPAGVDAPESRATAARTSAQKSAAAASVTSKAASGATRARRAASPPDPGPSIESPRPPGPIHPGAALDSMQEHAGGIGSLLALWGPLIIVGFLVLVFRGGDDGETSVAAAAGEATTEAVSAMARAPQPGGGVAPTRASAPAAVAHGAAEALDGGFAMRTSMAGPPVYTGREPGAGIPAAAPRSHYPPPPGPYRDPRYGSLPIGGSWPADGTRDWMWSAEGPARPRQDGGGDAPVQWVRCAPPYYWCPAPSSPAW